LLTKVLIPLRKLNREHAPVPPRERQSTGREAILVPLP